MIIDALDRSDLARSLLGDELVNATVATRRHKLENHSDKSAEELAAMFRLAWSI